MDTPTLELQGKLRIAAEFVGWESNKYPNLPNRLHRILDGQACGIPVNQLSYHTDYNQLHELWDKFKRTDLAIVPTDCLMEFKDRRIDIQEGMLYETKEVAFNRLVSAIIWLNSIKQS